MVYIVFVQGENGSFKGYIGVKWLYDTGSNICLTKCEFNVSTPYGIHMSSCSDDRTTPSIVYPFLLDILFGLFSLFLITE